MSARLSPNVRCWLAVAILLVPLALAAPSHLPAEVRAANGNMARFPPPVGVSPRDYNKALAVGVVAHVPSHTSISVVGPKVSLAQSWTRWLAYVIAPRLLTTGAAQWTLVFGETPAQAHLHPRQAWKYGADWLVER